MKSKKDIEGLRRSGAILAEVLERLQKESHEGVSLKSLDSLARTLLKEMGAYPTFLGYTPEGGLKPYPAAICTSVNEVVVHGIPSSYMLRQGDILKIDIGVTYEGYITDGAITVGVGKISKEARHLMDATREALEDAIKMCVPHRRLGDIGWTIESTAKKHKLSVLRGLTGHGVGFELHEDPTVYNYGTKGTGTELVPGLVLAIEPMFALGSTDIIQCNDESYATRDGNLSAHFEHTIVVTENGNEILTK